MIDRLGGTHPSVAVCGDRGVIGGCKPPIAPPRRRHSHPLGPVSHALSTPSIDAEKRVDGTDPPLPVTGRRAVAIRGLQLEDPRDVNACGTARASPKPPSPGLIHRTNRPRRSLTSATDNRDLNTFG